MGSTNTYRIAQFGISGPCYRFHGESFKLADSAGREQSTPGIRLRLCLYRQRHVCSTLRTVVTMEYRYSQGLSHLSLSSSPASVYLPYVALGERLSGSDGQNILVQANYVLNPKFFV